MKLITKLKITGMILAALALAVALANENATRTLFNTFLLILNTGWFLLSDN